ncbi:S8 family peptidase [Deminuibacter soli]|uniref:Peptidase S8 n=1 Tax=Deminuibacter soli TaxID=2291815 RepID=A0A3E1NEF2_9BACT|nr:S8 family peptidase [Deminuibacter soli]RFM26365.1 peptidase S8 [Deminuibacter soli]
MIKQLCTIAFAGCSLQLAAQRVNWQNLDLNKDSVFGASTEKAYRELLQNRQAAPVLVAVIDGGSDTAHEDLKDILWTNTREIPGNGIDDDHNGYADDIHGWDFIGSAKGDVNQDNTELVRLLRLLQPRFSHLTSAGGKSTDTTGYSEYLRLQNEYNQKLQEATMALRNTQRFGDIIDAIVKRIGIDAPAVADFNAYKPANGIEKKVVEIIVQQMQDGKSYAAIRKDDIGGTIDHFKQELDYHLNLSFDPRDMVGDDYNNARERYYGNPDVTGPSADHGTHVAGIIAASRTNNKGIMGVCNAAKVMVVRVVPDGDERDKDVANGIRYAVDNGAKVINMSFGKSYSPGKSVIDEAVKYAMKKDVLLVHAAGNDASNNDSVTNFPNRVYADGSGVAAAWIEVGASGIKDDEHLAANFSNYGARSVDVFAPGVDIYSTTPGSQYGTHSGTSMAAPVVTGIAATIRAYYPKLTAVQVKDIIMRSAVKITHPVSIKINGAEKQVPFSALCLSGGIVNTYAALQLAATE